MKYKCCVDTTVTSYVEFEDDKDLCDDEIKDICDKVLDCEINVSDIPSLRVHWSICSSREYCSRKITDDQIQER